MSALHDPQGGPPRSVMLTWDRLYCHKLLPSGPDGPETAFNMVPGASVSNSVAVRQWRKRELLWKF